MKTRSVNDRINTYNSGRHPQGLEKKLKAMQNDSFAFLRGTAHLFYEDWPQQANLNNAPLAWVCGDLHLQNFGAYKGDNRLTYFDINDFDEALLAPCTWDLARFLTSLLIAAPSLALSQTQALALCQIFLDTYSAELVLGKARWVERATATGIIKDLFKGLKKRSRADLLNERTSKENGERKLKLDGEKIVSATEEQKKWVKRLITGFAERQPNPKFFQVLDVAQRFSGLSSLGLERYVILVFGKGAARHYLLDLKAQTPSALAPFANSYHQPDWVSAAERTAILQYRGQAIAPAFLDALQDGDKSFLLKELMPQQDRLDLEGYHGEYKRLQKTIRTMAQTVAWLHIRTSGWCGSATADHWQQFGKLQNWQSPLLAYAIDYSEQVMSDWQRFKTGA